jgi:hypothetical protein
MSDILLKCDWKGYRESAAEVLIVIVLKQASRFLSP